MIAMRVIYLRLLPGHSIPKTTAGFDSFSIPSRFQPATPSCFQGKGHMPPAEAGSLMVGFAYPGLPPGATVCFALRARVWIHPRLQQLEGPRRVSAGVSAAHQRPEE